MLNHCCYVTYRIFSLLSVFVKGSKWHFTHFHHFPAKIWVLRQNIFFPYPWPMFFICSFFEAIVQLFILQFWTKCHRTFFWYSEKNMSTTLFPLSFHWKMVPFTYLFKSKIFCLNGPWHPIFFDQFDSLSVKNTITKSTALLIETSNRPEPP